MLLLFHLLGISSLFPEIVSSHRPGAYKNDIILELSSDRAANFISYSFEGSASGTSIPYTVPIVLTAVPGEERTYKLVGKH